MKELELDELEKHPSGIEELSKMGKQCSIQMVKSKKIRQALKEAQGDQNRANLSPQRNLDST
jgi:hypothetical protein